MIKLITQVLQTVHITMMRTVAVKADHVNAKDLAHAFNLQKPVHGH